MVTKAYNETVTINFNDSELGQVTITNIPVQEAAQLKLLYRIALALEHR